MRLTNMDVKEADELQLSQHDPFESIPCNIHNVITHAIDVNILASSWHDRNIQVRFVMPMGLLPEGRLSADSFQWLHQTAYSF